MILQVFLLLASVLQILTYAAFMNFMLEPRFAPRLNFWLTAGGYLLAAVVSRLLEAHTLANKAALCRRENITLEASLDVPEATGLSDGELCSVFANLLDNAIKAVRPLPPDRRRITIKAGPDGGSLLLKTENPYDPTQYRKGKGLGQGIVRDIAKAHDGDFLALPQGEKFVCLLSLQLVQDQP